MRRIKHIILVALTIMLAVGMCGCGNDSTGRTREVFTASCTIDEDDKTTEYTNKVTSQESIDYYLDFIASLEDKEPLEDCNQINTYDTCCLYYTDNANYIHNGYSLAYYISYGYDDLDNAVENHTPMIIVSGTNANKYELTGQEYDEFLSHIQDDATGDGNENIVTYKVHNDSYYAITDDYPKDSIILVNRYQNWAWGYQCSGSFIDSNGYVYEFDFSNHDFSDEVNNNDANINNPGSYTYDNAFMDALCYEVYYKESPSQKVDDAYMSQIMDTAFSINYDAEWKEKSVACDAGQSSIYVVEDLDMHEIYTSGDWEGYLDDASAKSLQVMIQGISQYCTEVK